MLRRTASHAAARVGTLAVAGALAVGAAPGAASAADADIRIIGGDASATVVCGNVATAAQLAATKHLKLQHSRCKANAVGGSVALENVEIYVSATARAANRDDPVLAAASGTALRAVDDCDNHRTVGLRGQLNKCWAEASGGRILLDKVTSVATDRAGQQSSKRLDRVSVGSRGTASADCRNVVSHRLNQRDDCTGRGLGAAWSLSGVDVVVRNADGSRTTRRGIDVVVRGGAATGSIHCFNLAEGTGTVRQLNLCSSATRGGDVTLRNVVIHTRT